MNLKGLNPTPITEQKFSFGATFGYVPPEQLPYEFDVGEPLEIKNQNIPAPSFVCVAEAGVSVSEDQEGVVLEPAYRIKNITNILGSSNWINEGTDLATGAKAAKMGDLEREESPYSVEKDGVEFCADPKNWPATYDEMAAKHAKKDWFWIGTSGGSMFERIKGAMYRFKDEKRSIQTGVMWQDNWLKTYINETGNPTGGHSIKIKGWKGDWLKIQNSIGKEIGENGIQYFHKDLVNKLFTFGAIMFADIPPYQTKESIIFKSQWYRSGFWSKSLLLIKNFILWR